MTDEYLLQRYWKQTRSGLFFSAIVLVFWVFFLHGVAFESVEGQKPSSMVLLLRAAIKSTPFITKDNFFLLVFLCWCCAVYFRWSSSKYSERIVSLYQEDTIFFIEQTVPSMIQKAATFSIIFAPMVIVVLIVLKM